MHNDKIYDGINLNDNFPSSIDFHDVYNDFHNYNNRNFNINIIGSDISGINSITKKVISKLVEDNFKTVIIDVNGEYKDLTISLGGNYLKASDICVNLFDLNEDEIMYSEECFEEYFNDYINQKSRSITNFIDLAAQERMKKELTSIQRSFFMSLVRELYKDIGINYSNKDTYLGEDKNQMPTFLGFCNKLDTLIEDANKYNENLAISRAEYDSLHLLFDRVDEYILNVQALEGLSLILKECREDGLFGIFNGPTSDPVNFNNSDLITFDLSDIIESHQSMSVYGILEYIGEIFGRKDSSIKKKIVYNGIYGGNKNQNYFISELLSRISKIGRKRNCGTCIVYHEIEKVENKASHSWTLRNAGINVFLRQNQLGINELKKQFHISEKDEKFLLCANPNDMLIKLGEEIIKVTSNDNVICSKE
ncbi:hypothetical protein NE686_17410 [Tissierella carlieri]|uniref:TraG P-loop domain-containing protein n=1 Tax=Tissierella carlieri TaxID=689904 RepID=A0ABT1SEP1_9FIRM|nr:hypothetical protein [Tissierella carlieri]MCQ4924884.1 hypothetical protein [Tissierella carlieri]